MRKCQKDKELRLCAVTLYPSDKKTILASSFRAGHRYGDFSLEWRKPINSVYFMDKFYDIF